MPSRPLLVFCLRDIECPLVKAIRRGADWDEGNGNGCKNDLVLSFAVPPLAARLLRMARYQDLGYTELWIRVSGGKEALSRFSTELRRLKGVYYQVVFENKFNKIIRVVVSHDSQNVCPLARLNGFRECPLSATLPGAMVKSTLMLPEGILYELIAARSNVLDMLRENWGCKILDVRSLDEMDYMLTEKQELALVYAYLSGYYNFPRRTSLKTLASKLGLSVSTLAEFLRRAEAKVVDAFVRHELPHYMAAVILHGPRCIESIEAALSGKNGKRDGGKERKPKPAIAAAELG